MAVLVTVSFWPLRLSTPFQLLVICWLPPQAQFTVHPVLAEVPVFVTVTLAVNPVPHWLATV